MRRGVCGARAHPRSRGENTNVDPIKYGLLGSSPLTRGKQPPARRHRVPRGLIPTHAGKTRPARNQPGHAWAHPRSRGENRTVTLYARGDLGSSPLTRGKRLSEPGARHLQGLIPTHAGKTRGPTSYPFPGWAHPRSRGENMGSLFLQRHMVGSSPLTRGKRKPRAPLLHRDGLIPTHAGKMTGTWPPPCPSPAHPHSRRENAPHGSRKIVCPGSSPLMRGKRTHAAA